MTEPTWKDPLLREWEKDGLEPWTDAVLQQHKAPRNAIPTDVLVVLVLAQAVETNHGADYYRLRSLIDAELARGREAVDVLRGSVTFGRPCPWCECYVMLDMRDNGHAPDCRLAKVIGEKP